MNRSEEMSGQTEHRDSGQKRPAEQTAYGAGHSANLAPLSPGHLIRRLGRPFEDKRPKRVDREYRTEGRQDRSTRLESRPARAEQQFTVSDEQLNAAEIRARNTAYAVMLFKDAIDSGFFRPAQPTLDSSRPSPGRTPQ